MLVRITHQMIFSSQEVSTREDYCRGCAPVHDNLSGEVSSELAIQHIYVWLDRG